MLTDEQIEKLLYEYAKRQDEFSLSVIRIIANRLKRIADFDALTALSRIITMQEDISRINDEYTSYKSDQKKRLERDLWWIVEYIYGEALLYYETQITLEANKELITAVNDLVENAQTEFAELINNPVFVIRDLQNPIKLKAYNLEQTYRSVINEAMSYTALSDELLNNALKRTETQLFASGVRYASDNSFDNANTISSAIPSVRMNVLNSMKKLINKVQDIVGKQFGANGVELSAHIYPAPDHAPAQGHQFTQENIDKMQSGEDFEDINGRHYIGFERQIGQWNCRHYFMKVKLGKNPTYTQEQLDKILEDNERGYTAPNGRHYTLYECTQIQRRYERNIRKAKEKYLFSKSLGNKNDMFTARGRVGALTTQYKQFSRACGIPAKLERIRVKDY
jgi:hypothetical protein